MTLCEKLYGKISPKNLETQLQALCEGLQATVKVVELTDHRWIRVNISGEDETAASNLFKEKFDFAPVELDYIKQGSVQKGKIIASGRSSTEIHADIGVFIPKPVDAFISLQHLQAQLVDGKKLHLQQIAHLYCLVDHFPLKILVKRLDDRREGFVAEFSQKQLDLFSEWIFENLERLVVLGTFSENVEEAVKATGHLRDVVEVESLGLLEHAVVCKLGTEAAGLIPKIGRLLPSAVLKVFSPREIQRFTETFR